MAIKSLAQAIEMEDERIIVAAQCPICKLMVSAYGYSDHKCNIMDLLGEYKVACVTHAKSARERMSQLQDAAYELGYNMVHMPDGTVQIMKEGEK